MGEAILYTSLLLKTNMNCVQSKWKKYIIQKGNVNLYTLDILCLSLRLYVCLTCI